MRNVRNTQQPLIVALCGDSGSGKTTLTDGMVQVFGQERIVHICLDDYHTLDRATRLRTGITALHPNANDLALMTDQLGRLARGESVVKPIYDHKTGTFAAPEEIHPADIIIVHGLHPLYTEQLRSLALEDCIWAYMEEVSHLRPDRLNLLGRFYVGNVQRQSDPLALTQLIILYHVMRARKRMQRGEYVVRPQLKQIFGGKSSRERM